MFNLKNLVRPNILALKPYSSARDEFKGKEGVFLDANENPFGTLNRYPDSYQKTLKKEWSKLKNIPTDNIFTGNGSDEIIDLMYRIFCNPTIDKALTFTPTFGMYQVAADINAINLLKLPLNKDFQINMEKVKPILNTPNLKLIFICSPNNPTGNSFQFKDLDFILKTFKGIVVIDEAYIDFSSKASFTELLSNYPNLIVIQTMSKAWALASARVGIAFANESIIQLLNQVKMPYNISSLNQNAAIEALQNKAVFEKNKNNILLEKENLKTALNKLDIVKKIHPSDANFFLIEVENANVLYEKLVAKKIIVRNRSSLVKNSIRITVGTPNENEQLLYALRNI